MYDSDDDRTLSVHDIFTMFKSGLEHILPNDFTVICEALRRKAAKTTAREALFLNREDFHVAFMDRGGSSDLVTVLKKVFYDSRCRQPSILPRSVYSPISAPSPSHSRRGTSMNANGIWSDSDDDATISVVSAVSRVMNLRNKNKRFSSMMRRKAKNNRRITSPRHSLFLPKSVVKEINEPKELFHQFHKASRSRDRSFRSTLDDEITSTKPAYVLTRKQFVDIMHLYWGHSSSEFARFVFDQLDDSKVK